MRARSRRASARAGVVAMAGGAAIAPAALGAEGATQDHTFVANFGGERLAELCGVQTGTCPGGHRTGDPIGANGYPYDGLTRSTGVSIDSSGHVWLA